MAGLGELEAWGALEVLAGREARLWTPAILRVREALAVPGVMAGLEGMEEVALVEIVLLSFVAERTNPLSMPSVFPHWVRLEQVETRPAFLDWRGFRPICWVAPDLSFSDFVLRGSGLSR